MRGIRMKFLPLTLIMVFYTAGIISGQELKEMEYQELDKSHIILDRADRSLLIIESTIPNIRFISNKGIIPGTYKEEPKGVWQAQVSPGVQLITIQADGYLPISALRHNFPPRLAWGLRITAKPQAVSAGKGSIKIETIPPGADIIFNNIPMRDKSPFTLYDQPAAKHLISLHKEGYAPVDTIVAITADRTINISIALEKMYGSVRIDSDPPGASVFLDGENIGRTPVNRDKIETGDYTLVLHLEGYIDVVQGLTVEYGETAETVAKLVKQMGAVIVTSNPAGADIYLNGEYKGISGTDGLKIEYLQVGKYTVKAEIDRYFPEEKDVNVYLNQTENVNLILKPKPGAVFVVSNPSGAEVYLDDIKRNGFTPVKIDSVEAGSHRIIFRLAGYRSEVKS
ncbi:MAG: PEGA domain-containing protein, partial [FCB group bacterium]|nr:PEGA domain-containing protein [FCB group bacterium]